MERLELVKTSKFCHPGEQVTLSPDLLTPMINLAADDRSTMADVNVKDLVVIKLPLLRLLRSLPLTEEPKLAQF